MKIAKKYNPQSELDEDFQVKKNLQQAVEFLAKRGWGVANFLVACLPQFIGPGFESGPGT